jgi:AcrR family transcriptional regulator
MVRKPKQERSKATVEAIVKAAALCVAELGYEGTSLRKIADKAGVGVGSIYEYFEDKEMIYEAMYDQAVTDVVRFISKITPEIVKLDTRSGIVQLLQRFKVFMQQEDELYLKLIQQSAGRNISVESEPLQDVLSKLAMQYIMQNPESARLKTIPALSYILINGGMAAVVKHVADPNPPITFEELAETLGDIVESYGQFKTS